jgi:hypothetical protein
MADPKDLTAIETEVARQDDLVINGFLAQETKDMETDEKDASDMSGQEMSDEDSMLDVSKPFPPHPDAQVEEQQFTARAVLTGCFLGGLIAASNMYLALKTGYTFMKISTVSSSVAYNFLVGHLEPHYLDRSSVKLTF